MPDDPSTSSPPGMDPDLPPRKQLLLPLALTPVFVFVAVTDVPAPRAGIVAAGVGLLAGVALFEGLRSLNVAGVNEWVVTLTAIALIVGAIGVGYGLAPEPRHALAALGILGTIWSITLESLRVQYGHASKGAQSA